MLQLADAAAQESCASYFRAAGIRRATAALAPGTRGQGSRWGPEGLLRIRHLYPTFCSQRFGIPPTSSMLPAPSESDDSEARSASAPAIAQPGSCCLRRGAALRG